MKSLKESGELGQIQDDEEEGVMERPPAVRREPWGLQVAPKHMLIQFSSKIL